MFTTAKSFASFSVDDINTAKAIYGKTLGLKMAAAVGINCGCL